MIINQDYQIKGNTLLFITYFTLPTLLADYNSTIKYATIKLLQVYYKNQENLG